MHVCVHVFGHKIYGKNIEIYIHACTLSILSASCSNISALKHTLLSLFLTASDQSIPLCYSYWLHQIRAYLFVTVTYWIRSEHTSLLLLLTGSDQSIFLCYCYWLHQIRAYLFVNVIDRFSSVQGSVSLLLIASVQSILLCHCSWLHQFRAYLFVTVFDRIVYLTAKSIHTCMYMMYKSKMPASTQNTHTDTKHFAIPGPQGWGLLHCAAKAAVCPCPPMQQPHVMEWIHLQTCRYSHWSPHLHHN